MESLNLNNLASSLPTSGLANAEAELMNNFKAAALSITTLYKSSRRTSKRAYNAGYAAACQDLLLMIQQGVSAGESSDPNGGGMTIGRIMDYIEARLEAIKSREEEEDEDEERDKDKDRPRLPILPSAKEQRPATTKYPSPGTSSKAREFPLPMTPRSPPGAQPSPLPPRSPSQTSLRLPPTQPPTIAPRNIKPRGPSLKEAVSSHPLIPFVSTSSILPTSISSPVAIISPTEIDSSTSTLGAPLEVAGVKRRHATMALDSAATPTGGVITRRRTRSSRGVALAGPREPLQDQNLSQDVMDIEEEGGRERKRMTRR